MTSSYADLVNAAMFSKALGLLQALVDAENRLDDTVGQLHEYDQAFEDARRFLVEMGVKA